MEALADGRNKNKIFEGNCLRNRLEDTKIWENTAMISHRKIDLRMGDGCNWIRII
jgi:hypothetical protein